MIKPEGYCKQYTTTTSTTTIKHNLLTNRRKKNKRQRAQASTPSSAKHVLQVISPVIMDVKLKYYYILKA